MPRERSGIIIGLPACQPRVVSGSQSILLQYRVLMGNDKVSRGDHNFLRILEFRLHVTVRDG